MSGSSPSTLIEAPGWGWTIGQDLFGLVYLVGLHKTKKLNFALILVNSDSYFYFQKQHLLIYLLIFQLWGRVVDSR